MAVAAVAAGALAGPSTASAEGGVDPTRFCIQDGVNTYLYYPYSVKSARTLAFKALNCSLRFADYLADSDNLDGYRQCLLTGLAQSSLPHDPTPLIVALEYCTTDWLQFEIQVDPNPE